MSGDTPVVQFGDYDYAMKFRNVVRQIVTAEIDKIRPRYQYATVTAIDRVLRNCTVQFPGDTTTVKVNMGSLQPATVGQVVRVAGLMGDRFIDDVMGPTNYLTVPSVLESGIDLDTLTASGAYHQTLNANATLALHYPDIYAGLLEVNTGDGTQVFQKYMNYRNAGTGGDKGDKVYVRSLHAGVWSTWFELQRVDDVAWISVAAGAISGVTLGNGTATFRYKAFPTYVIGSFKLVLGSTTSITGAISPNLPIAYNTAYQQGDVFGSSSMFSTIGNIEIGTCSANNGPYGLLFPLAEIGYAGPTKPITWAAGNRLSANFAYER